jgi:hypothetical protein
MCVADGWMVDWLIGGMSILTVSAHLYRMHAGNFSRDNGFGGSAKHGTVCLLPMLVGMCAVH